MHTLEQRVAELERLVAELRHTTKTPGQLLHAENLRRGREKAAARAARAAERRTKELPRLARVEWDAAPSWVDKVATFATLPPEMQTALYPLLAPHTQADLAAALTGAANKGSDSARAALTAINATR